MFKYISNFFVLTVILVADGLCCGAGVLPVFDDGTVLLGKEHRRNFDTWSDFGGKIDKGENTPQAALREFREETGHTSFPNVTLQMILNSNHVTATNGYIMYVVRVPGPKISLAQIQANAAKKPAHVEKFKWSYIGIQALFNS